MRREKAYIIFSALVVALIIILLFMTSCTTPEKMLGKVVGEKPGIVADYCARTYPCLPSEIRSDTITVYDTLWGQPSVQIYSDTVRVNDTVRIVKTVRSSPATITRTVTIRDSVKIIDKAALDACMIERKQETERANKEQKAKEEFRISRNMWRLKAIGTWIMVGAAGFLWLLFYIKRRTKK